MPCRECQHWAVRIPFDLETAIDDSYQWSDEDQAEYVARLTERHRWSVCARMTGPQWSDRQEGTLAVAQDASAYAAKVLTREDFGCVMFAAKE